MLHDYLYSTMNWTRYEIARKEDRSQWNAFLNNWFMYNNQIPAGSVVLYDNGYTGKGFTFDHAAITTGITVEFSGVTGPQVVDRNNLHVNGPHSIADTSTPQHIVILVSK